MAARVPAEAVTLSLFVTTHLICNFYSADFVLKQRIQWCLSLIHSQKMILDISVGNFRWLRERIEKRIENYSSGPEDDSDTMKRSVTGGNQRKLHRVWNFFGGKEVVRWCCSFRGRKMDSYKKSLFSSSTHQTPIHLKMAKSFEGKSCAKRE
ncbi:uncharacterized protein LOC110938286 isoform X3 [Helianthus annuus]|uniref:uncharacterized protein LOC110938286 isoform X3 n=1 Tax=Helianthus annuus TaxID=4232 RepID=UPI001652D363|nr:uncharacterized protein LOC110938286 isoform X3 [Helianthus annuus]XP_035830247.1 uncharacterized protein LOC110938286 isoform X3 [Helianthus annuus]